MNRRHTFYMLWLVVTILCAAIAFITAAYVAFSRAPAGSEPVHQTAVKPTPVEATEEPEETEEPTPTPEPTPEPAPVILEETEDMGEEYLSKIVFLGDSTTYALGVYGVLPFTQVWVPNNGTLTLSNQSYVDIDYYSEDGSVQALSIKDAAALRQPEYLIITLGLNGISFMDEEQFKTEYTDVINSILEVSPDTKIICHSIYPVIDSLVSVNEIGNERINRANGWILDVATETGTRYLNTHDALTDETGNLKAEYNAGVGDGIHLNGDGLQVITNSVRTHGYR